MRKPDACPGCESAQYVATGSRTPGFSTSIGGQEFTQPAYFVRECVECGLLYRTNPLSAETLSKYYSLVDFHKWEISGFYPPERFVISILRRLPPGTPVLDFGCSSGRLLAGLSSIEGFGFEINPLAAAEAQRKGLQMLTADQIRDRNSACFGAIVLVDVFEHLQHPLRELRCLLRLLEPGGLLIMSTGNGDASACRRDPAQFWYFRTLEHLSMLTRKHIAYLTKALPIRLKCFKELCHYDLPISERIFQRIQQFAYWQFHCEAPLAKSVLSLMPILRRANRWEIAPVFTSSRDHVVVVFESTR
jgi:SAM-dependent methyltransferase